MSDRRYDTIGAFTLVIGIMVAGLVLIAAACLWLGPVILQRGFTTDIPK